MPRWGGTTQGWGTMAVAGLNSAGGACQRLIHPLQLGHPSVVEGDTIMLNTNGLHHLALRVTDLQRAKAFYSTLFGMQPLLEREDLAILSGNGLLLGLRATPAPGSQDHFDPFRVGLDHLAVAAADIAALEQMQRQLDGAGVRNNGVEHDALTGATYVSFSDPDGIAWELYVLPTSSEPRSASVCASSISKSESVKIVRHEPQTKAFNSFSASQNGQAVISTENFEKFCPPKFPSSGAGKSVPYGAWFCGKEFVSARSKFGRYPLLKLSSGEKDCLSVV